MSTVGDGKREDAGPRLLAVFDALSVSHAGLSAEDIHRLRVAIKQTRAWLKLCHALTGKTADYQQLVKNLQDLSRALSGQRDRDVALKTLSGLGRKYPGKKAQQLIDVLSQQLASVQTPAPDAAALHHRIEQIRSELLPFTQLVLPRDSRLSVIRRAYPKMCQRGEAALATEACIDLHAWRKRVKTLGYQLAMLEHPLPHAKKVITTLNKLGHRLGEIHDLCFLQEMVEDADAQRPFTLDPAPLLKRIGCERRRLIATARKQHARVCRSHGWLVLES